MFLLIDGSNLFHRVFHSGSNKGFEDYDDTEDALETAARLTLLSFLTQLSACVRAADKIALGLPREDRFVRTIIVWEGRGSLRLRRAIFPSYKKRARVEDPRKVLTLYAVMGAVVARLEKVAPRFNIAYPGCEADDIIGILSEAFSFSNDVLIASTDRDFCQLITSRVRMLNTRDYSVIDKHKVQSLYGVAPESFIAYKALVGDSSDNYPGERGIGAKGAQRLLNSDDSWDKVNTENHELMRALATIPFAAIDVAAVLSDLANTSFDTPANWRSLESLNYEGNFVSKLEKIE